MGTTKKLAAEVSPLDATHKVAWISDDTNVATVDQDGNITAAGIGTTTITATVDGGFRYM